MGISKANAGLTERRRIHVREWLPFTALFLVMLAMHFNMSMGLADDTIYAAVLGQQTLREFWTTSYNTWSSRQLLEAAVVYVIHAPLLWRVLDSLLFALAARWLYRSLGPAQRTQSRAWLICALCAMYPMANLVSAGWVVTTVIYIWPLALGLYGVSVLMRLTRDEHVGVWEYPLAALATLFAANMEQVAVALFVIDAALLIWNLLRKNRRIAYFFVSFAVVLADIVYSRTCPGVAERTINETNGWFPDFAAVPLWRKLEMGFSSTIRDFAMKPNLTFFLFAIVLLAAVVLRTKKTAARACAAVPLFVVVLFGWLGNDPNRAFNGLCVIVESIGQYGTAIRLKSVASWVPDIIMVGLVVAIVYALWSVFDAKEEKLGAVLAITAGFGSRMVMSLSPTIWASGARTYCFLYFAFYALLFMLIDRVILPSDSKLRQPLLICIVGVALAALANSMALAV